MELLFLFAAVAIAVIAHVFTRRSVIQASLIASFTAGMLCAAMQVIDSWPSKEMDWCTLRMVFSFPALIELLLALVIGAIIADSRNHTLGRPVRDPTKCTCGYNLTGNLSGICPECGRPFCHNCGENQLDYYAICPYCGKPYVAHNAGESRQAPAA